jgi:hypothetical protein
MTDQYFVGLRATGDLATNERPESWREGILRLFPNGDMPLTALTALMQSEDVTDPHYHWWTKGLTTQRSAITNIYTDVALSNPYTSGGVAGTTLYVNIPAAGINMFRTGQVVLLRDASHYDVDCAAKVTDVQENGASSYVVVSLLEADDNGASTDLSDADVILIMGNANPQGGTRPEAITQSPTEHENYTQIFRDSLDLARTLMKTKLRSEQAYLEAKRDALELHGIGMEKAFIWGVASSLTGVNGKPETTTGGLLSFIKAAGTVADYTLETGAAYAGMTWLQAGDQWMDEHLEEIFRYGADEKLAFCGSGALLGLNRLAKSVGNIQLNVREKAFGIQVVEWVTPFGVINLKRHPLFSYEATNRNSMVIFEPKQVRYKYITDTMFKADKSDMEGGGTGVDGKQEEYLTEAGLEFHHGEKSGYLNGVGLDNDQS